MFVGVDGGGTHTVALAGRSSSETSGRGEAGPSNPSAVGFDRAADEIARAVRQALGDARPGRIAMGVAGAGRPADGARLGSEVAARLGVDASAVRVVQDVAILLPAAGLSSGVAIVAGTGSSAFGAAPDGRTTTTGGWGYLLGDEGSAFFVGREALLAVARADDGTGPPTALTGAVLSKFAIPTPRDVITAVYQSAAPRNTIAGLAPAVVSTAAEGDPAARDILALAGRELAAIACAVARKLDLDAPSVVAVGGMLEAGELLLGPLREALAAGGLTDLRRLESDPALGALRIASGEIA